MGAESFVSHPSARLLVALGFFQVLLGNIVSVIPEPHWLIYRFMINTHHEFVINGLLLVLLGFSFVHLGFQESRSKSLVFVVFAFLGTFSNGFAFLVAGLWSGEGSELTPSFNALAHHASGRHLKLGNAATYILLFVCSPIILGTLIFVTVQFFKRALNSTDGRTVDFLTASLGYFIILFSCLIGVLPPTTWIIPRYAVAAHVTLCYSGLLLVSLGMILFPSLDFSSGHSKFWLTFITTIGTCTHGGVWYFCAYFGEPTLSAVTINKQAAVISPHLRGLLANLDELSDSSLLLMVTAPALLYAFATLLCYQLLWRNPSKDYKSSRLLSTLGTLLLGTPCFASIVPPDSYAHYPYAAYGHVALVASGLLFYSSAPLVNQTVSSRSSHLFVFITSIANLLYPGTLFLGALTASPSSFTPISNRFHNVEPSSSLSGKVVTDLFWVCTGATILSLFLAICVSISAKGTEIKNVKKD